MLIRSHSAAVGPELDEAEVRATLLVRLNCLLADGTGVSWELVERYRDFLNLHLHPVIPGRGSIGEADLVSLAHVGLAVMGEGDVTLRGERMEARRALSEVGLEPLVLGCKEGLAIVSSNAMSAGLAALVFDECERLMDAADLLYALALEGYGGNVSPLDAACFSRRPVPGPTQTAARVRRYLEDSVLWKGGVAATMQDPLCFRSACHVHGAVRDALSYLRPQLLLQVNSTDDNPCVLSEEGRFAHNSNFEVTSWVLGFEMLGLALSHLARNICYQVIKLDSPAFSRLPRFLSPDGTSVMAYTTNQKTFLPWRRKFGTCPIPSPRTTWRFPVRWRITPPMRRSSCGRPRKSPTTSGICWAWRPITRRRPWICAISLPSARPRQRPMKPSAPSFPSLLRTASSARTSEPVMT